MESSENTPAHLPLPPELIVKLLKENAYDKTEHLKARHMALARCCLVSKAFLPLAQSLLYEEIEFDTVDLVKVTSLYTSLQNGCFRHVRKLGWTGDVTSVKTLDLAGKATALLATCTGIETFDSDQLRYFKSDELTDFHEDCVSKWSNLVDFSAHNTIIDGDALLNAHKLKHIIAGDITYPKTSFKGAPPTFHLRSLLLEPSAEIEKEGLAFLTASSSSSLLALSLSPISLNTSPGLSSFINLRILCLLLPQLTADKVKVLISLLSSLSHTLANLELDASGNSWGAQEHLEKQDFLRALPPNLKVINLVGEHDFPSLSPQYVGGVLRDMTVLAKLEELTIGRYYEEDHAYENAQAKLASWLGKHRPQLSLEWRVSGNWSEDEW